MPGVRLRHASIRSSLYAVPLIDQPLQGPRPICGKCLRETGHEVQHPVKTVHLNVDGEGAVMVSPEIWVTLQGMGGAGFTVANEVTVPPAQGVTPALVSEPIQAFDFGANGQREVTVMAWLENQEANGVTADEAIAALFNKLLGELVSQGHVQVTGGLYKPKTIAPPDVRLN